MSLNTLMVWVLVLGLSLIDGLWLRAEGLSLAPQALLSTLLPIAGAGLISFIYTYVRPDLRIATLTHMIALTLAFTAVTMVLSYILVALKQPLIDNYLIDKDRSLGFYWPTIYALVLDHPNFHRVLQLIYLSLVPQMIFYQLFFNYRRQYERAWELQWLFVLLCLSCLTVSGLWPAAGAFGAFHIQTEEPYVKEFIALRAGTLKVIGQGGVQGLIQFPSLHTALAVLYIYMARGQGFLFPLFLTLNLLVILATPVIGGHHFFDLLGGAVLALSVIGLKSLFKTNSDAQNESAGRKAGT